MNILGLNINHADTSATLIVGNEIIASVEEERFKRIKHYAGFPYESISYCLNKKKIKISDLDYLCLNFDRKSNFKQKLKFVLKNFYRPNVFKRVLKRTRNFNSDQDLINYLKKNEFKGQIINIDHHLSHMSSSFFCSPYENAVGLTLDGFGDFVSTESFICQENKIQSLKKVFFPHSLGILYQSITQLLGFKNYGDEYKVMGLAPYGDNNYASEFNELIKVSEHNYFMLNLDYFRHHKSSDFSSFKLVHNAPVFENLYSKKIYDLFKIDERSGGNLEKKHFDIAFSLQKKFEEVVISILNSLYEKYKINNLCLAGGCALNSKFNGLITKKTNFKNVFIQPNAGDAGGSLGSSLMCSQLKSNSKKINYNFNVYSGPTYSDEYIENNLIKNINQRKDLNIKYYSKENTDLLNHYVAEQISNSKIIGWFKNSCEWGPRALGNRSILADPRNPNIKNIINAKIKLRESFRPFAPAILEKFADEYFYMLDEKNSPFMLKIFKARELAKRTIPSVVHVDDTCRVQTVNKQNNEEFYNLIDKFYQLTQTPVILNTSFNENEPIVLTPNEAFDCFDRTDMDIISLQNWVIEKKSDESNTHN